MVSLLKKYRSYFGGVVDLQSWEHFSRKIPRLPVTGTIFILEHGSVGVPGGGYAPGQCIIISIVPVGALGDSVKDLKIYCSKFYLLGTCVKRCFFFLGGGGCGFNIWEIWNWKLIFF